MTETLRRGYPGMKVARAHHCFISLSKTDPHILSYKYFKQRVLLHDGELFYLQDQAAVYAPVSITTQSNNGVVQSIKDMPVLQDGPPPGGFPSVRFARRIPSTGPTGFTLFALGAVVMAFGFVKVGETNRERKLLKAEKIGARKILFPVLQAEEDRRWVWQADEAVKSEAKIMQDVPGWKAGESVYNGKRWMPPARPVGVWGGLV